MGLRDRLRGRRSKSNAESTALAMVMLAPGRQLAIERVAQFYERIRVTPCTSAILPEMQVVRIDL